jgi:hypothetical protein
VTIFVADFFNAWQLLAIENLFLNKDPIPQMGIFSK